MSAGERQRAVGDGQVETISGRWRCERGRFQTIIDRRNTVPVGCWGRRRSEQSTSVAYSASSLKKHPWIEMQPARVAGPRMQIA